jgi:hypothetical protein
MKVTPISRNAVLTAVVVVVLAVAIPGAIRRLVETGDPYLFTQHFFNDILGRLSGPGRLRFIIQPLVATLLAFRDGRKDAFSRRSPFLWGLIFQGGTRSLLLREMFASIRNLLAVAILVDLVAQALIFHELHPGAALVVGPLLIGAPYCVARALTNRIFQMQRAAR